MKTVNHITLARTLAQAAQATGSEQSEITAAIESGELPVMRIGKRLLIEDAPLAAWAGSRPAKSVAETPRRAA